mmetsp:Transcript_47006/g.102264  ORF Transcript_47006/g.102264 Transcript_47006/m.102264 type:complete len:324 (-) Transcript_47006:136-1107(-)
MRASDEEALYSESDLSDSQGSSRRGSSSRSRFTALALVPTLAYMGLVAVFVFIHHFMPMLTWFALLVITLAGILSVAHAREMRLLAESPVARKSDVKAAAVTAGFYMGVGLLTLFATATAFVIGLAIYNRYVAQSYYFDEHRAYSNVLPSSLAGAHADAGVLTFAKGSHVDVTKAVGLLNNQRYCAAPVVGEGSAAHAEFWAVGVNCCDTVGDIWCDSISDKDVRSGAVVSDDSSFFSDISPGGREFDSFRKAVRQSAAQFGMTLPKNPIMVRWTASPSSVASGYFWYGIGAWLLSTLAMFFVCAAFAVLVEIVTTRAMKAQR